MSYQYITKYNSPNYTSRAATPGAYGMARKVEGITIHHWGDPANNPQFQGIVNYLCRANGNTSAHYVATGTNRQVACIVSPDDTAWHAGTAWGNARTIGIECDPRCRAEDIDVVAELVAQIRDAYGDVPIYWHSYFVATACPGRYTKSVLDKIDKLSYTKQSGSKWGQVTSKTAPAPVVKTKAVPAAKKLTTPLKFTAKLDPTKVWDLTTNPDYKAVTTIKKGAGFEAYAYIDFNGSRYYVTKYSFEKGRKAGVNSNDLTPVPKPVQTEPSPTTKTPDGTTPLPDTGAPVTEKVDYSQENNSLLKQILELLKRIFNIT